MTINFDINIFTNYSSKH